MYQEHIKRINYSYLNAGTNEISIELFKYYLRPEKIDAFA